MGSLYALSSFYALKSQQKQISALNKEQFVLQLSSSRGESSTLDPQKPFRSGKEPAFPQVFLHLLTPPYAVLSPDSQYFTWLYWSCDYIHKNMLNVCL